MKSVDSWGARYANSCSWEEATRTLMLASKHLPVLPEVDRTPNNEVMGCESRVWVVMHLENNRVNLRGYSEGKIVRGLIQLIFEPLQHLTLSEFCDVDLHEYLSTLKLDKYLSPSRSNGLFGIVELLHAMQTQ